MKDHFIVLLLLLFLILTVQLLLNLAFTFFLKPKHEKMYKLLSYILFSFFAISLPVGLLVILFIRAYQQGAFNAQGGVSIEISNVIDFMVIAAGIILTQWIFNRFLLKEILSRRSST